MWSSPHLHLSRGFAGCLTVQGALASSDGNRPAHDVLVQWRNDFGVRLEQRFRRAVAEGDLPSGTDPKRLARYVMTVAFGLSVQAVNGLGRAELDEIIDRTMLTWR